MVDSQTALAQLEAAAADKRLSPGAVENIRTWLTEPYLEEYAPQVADHLAAGMWQELDDAFWTTIPFGTGGRRGKMYPIGCNAINDRTIGETAQGLADYVRRQVKDRPLSCVVAYDTRHRSRHFAELCSQIMAAAGFQVHFLDGYRSTPELSFAVRKLGCACGIMITASHNPPADNAVKAYWSGGGQLLPPHDAEAIEQMERVTWIKQIGFAQGLDSGQIVYCQQDVDAAYVERVLVQSVPGPRELKIIYSPLHGVGASAVCPVLEAAGFADVELFQLHAASDPEFSNVPGHSANPENSAVFDVIIERAKQVGADLILATDPDCDRLGCAVPTSRRPGAPWTTLTGNQIGALLADFLLGVRQAAGTLMPDHYVVKTLVTTELIRRIADRYGVQTAGNLLVGFKWIAGEMDRLGAEQFVFGAEESYGFLAGSHARDKDGAVAAMLLAELAARLKAEGLTLVEKLDGLFRRHGCHAEKTISIQMPGEQGMDDMQALMADFRSRPPESLGGLRVARTRDYLSGTLTETGGRVPRGGGYVRMPYPPTAGWQPLVGPKGDVVFFDLEAEGNYVAVRPSGTEPKVKFYMFAYDPPEASADLRATKAAQADRLAAMERDLRAFSRVKG
jgi:phosphoglucomutase/phosphomannomutase